MGRLLEISAGSPLPLYRVMIWPFLKDPGINPPWWKWLNRCAREGARVSILDL